MLEATILIFSYAYTISEPPVKDRVVALDSQESCIFVAKEMANKFDQEYPGGLFEAQCRDSQNRTFYLARNNRFGKPATCNQD